jgi:hypothetical protein
LDPGFGERDHALPAAGPFPGRRGGPEASGVTFDPLHPVRSDLEEALRRNAT